QEGAQEEGRQKEGRQEGAQEEGRKEGAQEEGGQEEGCQEEGCQESRKEASGEEIAPAIAPPSQPNRVGAGLIPARASRFAKPRPLMDRRYSAGAAVGHAVAARSSVIGSTVPSSLGTTSVSAHSSPSVQ